MALSDIKKISFSALLVFALILILVAILSTKILQFKSMSSAAEMMVIPPETVSTFTVEEQSWSKSLNAIGSIEPVQGVLIQTEIGGVVTLINFENGQAVTAGDLLVQLDISVEEAELKASQALSRLALLELKRTMRLEKSGNIPQSELDRALAESERRKAEVESIKARIARKTIRAPFSGLIGIREINLGQYVPSGSAIVSLQENKTVYANFTLPQQALNKLKKGYKVTLTSDAYPKKTFVGELTAISPEIDEKTRSVALQGTFKNPDGLLRAGLFVRVKVSLPDLKDLIVVPTTAVIYAPYGNSVYKVEQNENGTIARQYFITTGEQRGDYISIIKGAVAGDLVVSAGAFKLRNGMSVRINNDLAPEPELEPKPNNT